MSNYVICGKRIIDGEVYDLYANTATGEVVMESDLHGNCVLSEISVVDPLHLDKEEFYIKAIKGFQADGIIYSEKELIVLKGSTAEFRDFSNLNEVKATVVFDDSIVADDFYVD